MPDSDLIVGTVNNNGPGPVCAVCALGEEADQICHLARACEATYREIADALNAGAPDLRRPISDKCVWHHLHGHRGRRN